MNKKTQLLELAIRAVEALLSAKQPVPRKKTTKEDLCHILGGFTDFEAENLAKVERLVEGDDMHYDQVSKAEELGRPLLREPLSPRTPENEISEADTFSLFLSLVRFKYYCMDPKNIVVELKEPGDSSALV